MNQVTVNAFYDELTKMAGIGDLWHKLLHFFRSKTGIGRMFGKEEEPKEKSKAILLAEYHFSPKAGDDKWDKFVKNVRDPKFVEAIASHPQADRKLVQHTKSMYEMSRGPTVGKVKSFRLPGRSYEVKKIPGGLACTCPDWRFKGSVNPGYECKHIRAYRAGKVEA